MGHLVMNIIHKHHNCRTTSTAIQLQTNHGHFGIWYQRMGIKKDDRTYNYKQLKTV